MVFSSWHLVELKQLAGGCFALKSNNSLNLHSTPGIEIQKSYLYSQIFESKGDLGVPRNHKREVTVPQVSHLLTSMQVCENRNCTARAVVASFLKCGWFHLFLVGIPPQN